MSATVLYTPDVLGLAIELAGHPLTDDLTLRGNARSKSCGSTIALGLAVNAQSNVERVGLTAQACAIGQAAAAIFAAEAPGRSAGEIESARDAIAAWLGGEAGLPGWPGLHRIAAARDYPARHGAVLLPWNAAVEALSHA